MDITTFNYSTPINENWVLCLKHGAKYSTEYVNKLYNMTKRNLTVPFRFACITEDTTGLNSEIVHIPLPNYKISGWWFKSWVFSDELPINGNILFMDLDIVIIKNIDSLFTYSPGSFCIIKDFIRVTNPYHKKFNSSVFRFTSKSYTYIWNNLKSNLNQISQYHGDQDYLYYNFTDDYVFFPDIWLQSYKWEIRNRRELQNINGKMVFPTIAQPIIHEDTKVLVFHGAPNPSDIKDPIILYNWY